MHRVLENCYSTITSVGHFNIELPWIPLEFKDTFRCRSAFPGVPRWRWRCLFSVRLDKVMARQGECHFPWRASTAQIWMLFQNPMMQGWHLISRKVMFLTHYFLHDVLIYNVSWDVYGWTLHCRVERRVQKSAVVAALIFPGIPFDWEVRSLSMMPVENPCCQRDKQLEMNFANVFKLIVCVCGTIAGTSCRTTVERIFAFGRIEALWRIQIGSLQWAICATTSEEKRNFDWVRGVFALKYLLPVELRVDQLYLMLPLCRKYNIPVQVRHISFELNWTEHLFSVQKTRNVCHCECLACMDDHANCTYIYVMLYIPWRGIMCGSLSLHVKCTLKKSISFI